MKTYEEEVLSLPADGTINCFNQHHVYTCPWREKGYYLFKRFLYIAFRKQKGGAMDRLYKVKSEYRLPKTISEIEKIVLPREDRQAIVSYLSDPRVVQFAKKNYKGMNNLHYFVLDEKLSIRLPKSVRPTGRNNSHKAYFDFVDFFEPDKRRKLVFAEEH